MFTAIDTENLALTVFGEASGEGSAGRIGVVNSVLNRARDGHFPGGCSISGICTAHRQYDCWDEGTKDNARLKAATLADPDYAACYGLALLAQAGRMQDNTGGAVFYHDISLAGPPAVWGAVRFTERHGRLKFYARG